MPERVQVSVNDIQDPNRLFRLLRSMLDLIYSTGNSVELMRDAQNQSGIGVDPEPGSPATANRTSPGMNLLNGVTQPIQARLVLGLGNSAVLKHNLDSTTLANPAATNDWTQGYSVGSVWVNQTPGATNQAFMMVLTGAPAVGAAVWKQITV